MKFMKYRVKHFFYKILLKFNMVERIDYIGSGESLPLKPDWDGNELLLSDILGTDADIIYKFIEKEVDRDLLKEALSKLSPREKKIIDLRFGLSNGLERTQKEVADILGISQSYISRLEKRIIERLQKEVSRLI